jgi:hypothetical protein
MIFLSQNKIWAYSQIFYPPDSEGGIIYANQAGVVELVDAADSKSAGGNSMRVQVPPSAKISKNHSPNPFLRG